MTDQQLRERIHETRSVAFQNGHRRVAHLNATCSYLDAEPEEIDLSTYPQGHLDWCDWCLERFCNWHRNFHGFDPHEKPPRSQCRTL